MQIINIFNKNKKPVGERHPFSQNYNLALYITHVVHDNFKRDWRDLEFNVNFRMKAF